MQALVPGVLLGMSGAMRSSRMPRRNHHTDSLLNPRAPRAQRRGRRCRFASRPAAHIPKDAYRSAGVPCGFGGHHSVVQSLSCRKSSEPEWSVVLGSPEWVLPHAGCGDSIPAGGLLAIRDFSGVILPGETHAEVSDARTLFIGRWAHAGGAHRKNSGRPRPYSPAARRPSSRAARTWPRACHQERDRTRSAPRTFAAHTRGLSATNESPLTV